MVNVSCEVKDHAMFVSGEVLTKSIVVLAEKSWGLRTELEINMFNSNSQIKWKKTVKWGQRLEQENRKGNLIETYLRIERKRKKIVKKMTSNLK